MKIKKLEIFNYMKKIKFLLNKFLKFILIRNSHLFI
jgi:hypothetical protein